jgi:hypothetical protein
MDKKKRELLKKVYKAPLLLVLTPLASEASGCGWWHCGGHVS